MIKNQKLCIEIIKYIKNRQNLIHLIIESLMKNFIFKKILF